jgi:AraC-like DNA-binding protein
VVSVQAAQLHRFRSDHSPSLRGVEVVRAHHSGPLGAWQFIPMTRISVLLAGSVRVWAHGHGEVMKTGDSVINRPGSMPRIVERFSETTETLTIYLRSHLFEEVARAVGHRPRDLEVHVVSSPAVAHAAERLGVAIRDRVGEKTALHDLVDQTCHALAEGSRVMPGGPLRAEIERARALIQERAFSAVTLSDLADAAGMSKFHFLRLFREEIGTTPHAYKLHLRISRAREMLDAGVSAAEVAFACGFADQAHFTRAFKRIVGFTPAAFTKVG